MKHQNNATFDLKSRKLDRDLEIGFPPFPLCSRAIPRVSIHLHLPYRSAKKSRGYYTKCLYPSHRHSQEYQREALALQPTCNFEKATLLVSISIVTFLVLYLTGQFVLRFWIQPRFLGMFVEYSRYNAHWASRIFHLCIF